MHEQNEKALTFVLGHMNTLTAVKIVATPDKPYINLLHSQNSVNDIDL